MYRGLGAGAANCETAVTKHLSFIVFISFLCALFCAQGFARSNPDVAHRAQHLHDAVLTAVADPEVYLAGTAPSSPILTQDNRLDGLFAGTAATLDALCAMIDACEAELLIQVYQWNDGDASAQQVLGALQRRAARALAASKPPVPVVIRILVNGTWPAESTNSQQQLISFIHDLSLMQGSAERVVVELSAYQGFGLSVLHSKDAVRDSKQGLIMTGNFRTLGGPQHDYFNMGAAISGPAAATLRADWLTARARASQMASSAHAIPEPEFDGSEVAQPQANELGAAAVLTRTSRWRPWGDSHKTPQNVGLIALFDAAAWHIEAINPALNAPPIIDAIVRAAKRGVHQDLVLSLNMDRWQQHHLLGGDNADTAHKLYSALLTSGGPQLASRVNIVWASKDGIHAAEQNDEINVHAKAALFDDACLWVGSMNWDWLSWNTSRELSLALFGDYAPTWRKQVFAAVYAQTTPIKPSDLPLWAQGNWDPVYRWLLAANTHGGPLRDMTH